MASTIEPAGKATSHAEGGALSNATDSRHGRLPLLMPRRVSEILLVSSRYDSYIIEEDGLLSEMIYSEYADLGLTNAPNLTRVSTGFEALQMLAMRKFDIVITMLRLGDMDVASFSRTVREMCPDVRVILLVSGEWDLARIAETRHQLKDVEDIYIWHGDTRLFLAIIKNVEDEWNAEHDTRVGDVGVIIVVEDSVRFRSSLLPIIYTQLVIQTRAVMREGLNRIQKLMRLRARTKILTAETFENGLELFNRYRPYVVSVISDIEFPHHGRLDPQAGIELIREVKRHNPDTPCLLQSSELENRRMAEMVGANFLHKHSLTLLEDVRKFMVENCGFGDFVFRMPDGPELARASDLRDMARLLSEVPIESVEYHARRNHFSNWLLARTEFGIARMLRPRKVSEFTDDLERLRRYLVDAIEEALQQSRRGVVEEFSRQRFDSGCRFARLGGGSLGGKARGLAFFDTQIALEQLEEEFENVRIVIPRTVVIGTEVFDQFLDENYLRALALKTDNDDWIRWAFETAKFPERAVEDLKAYLDIVRTPIAVRSSSLLEDSQHHPFAGVYSTHMIPNNQRGAAERLDTLITAIKLVYASTYFHSARQALSTTPHRIEEEKMGVILQPVVGTRHHPYFYPSFAGVALSYNYYPFGHMRPEDGIAYVSLGLGHQVVDGGRALRFCPAYPNVIPELSETQQFLGSSQREFFAIDLERGESSVKGFPLTPLGLDVAEQHGTLAPVGSVWSPEDRALYDGIYRAGVRAVTFAHVLKNEVFPLAKVLRRVLDVARTGMNAPVELEFAVNLESNPKQFAVLQVRPCVRDMTAATVDLGDFDKGDLLCFSKHAMGNGIFRGITDVVYVKPETFNTTTTVDIASSVGEINDVLSREKRPYLLIGPGRWGTSNRWLGVPVKWSQISAARLIVETSLGDFCPELSQGSHFFHNLTAFGVGYLMIGAGDGGHIDWEWLSQQPATTETRYVRHVRLAEPIQARLDGRTSHGAVLKSESRASDE
ncbi:MAG: PEP/pyruvate-binding domain-containing protein [Phycisphaerae bacterium]|nr:PEP/pyruvate-binding domain-containing protein [Phycisphaerae bacterium]